MTTVAETKAEVLARLDGGEISDEDMVTLVGQERFDAMMADDGGDIPTLVYDIMGPNFFVKFSDRKDIEFLITQLADMLAHDDEDMAVRIPGKVVPFRETWDD